MKLWRIAFLSCLALAALVALAAPTAPKTPKVTATGTLTADGTGMARVMLIKGTVTISGKGSLEVPSTAKVTFSTKQAAPEKKTFGEGEYKRTILTYKKFSGSVTLTGESTSISLDGTGKISAKGAGFGMLFGKGNYTVQTGKEKAVKGKWADKPEPPKGGKPNAAPPKGKPDAAPPKGKPNAAPPKGKPDAAPPKGKPNAGPPPGGRGQMPGMIKFGDWERPQGRPGDGPGGRRGPGGPGGPGGRGG